MIILKVNENKVLSVNSTTGIYQSENNFDKFRVYVSPFISGHSVDTLTVNLNIVNPDEEMDIIELKLNKDTSNYFTQDLNLGVKYTSLPGQYRIYIKFINAEGVVGKTNYIHYVVEEIDEPADAISKKFITIIDQYNTKLLEITQKINDAESTVDRGVERITPTSIVAFTDSEILGIYHGDSISGGFFDGNNAKNAKYIFFSSTVTKIESGATSGLADLVDVYIDNTEASKKTTVASGAFQDGVKIHYKDDFYFGEFIAKILKSAKDKIAVVENSLKVFSTTNIIDDYNSNKVGYFSSDNVNNNGSYTDGTYLLSTSTDNTDRAKWVFNGERQLPANDYYIGFDYVSNTDFNLGVRIDGNYKDLGKIGAITDNEKHTFVVTVTATNSLNLYEVYLPNKANLNCQISNFFVKSKEDYVKTFNSIDEFVSQHTSYDVTPEMFGAVGNGVFDDTDCIKKAIEYSKANNAKIHFQNGKIYCISDTLDLSNTSTCMLDFNWATIKAIKTMDYMFKFDGSTNVKNDVKTLLKNVIIDCNSKAGGLNLIYSFKFTFENFMIKNCQTVAILIQKGGAFVCQNGTIIGNCTPDSRGIYNQTSDCHFNEIVIVDMKKCIFNGGTNFYNKVHGWLTSKVANSIFFEHFAGFGSLTQCQCDTYETGYLLRTSYDLSLVACTYYNNYHLYDSEVTPIVFKFNSGIHPYARRICCTNCSFNSPNLQTTLSSVVDAQITFNGYTHFINIDGYDKISRIEPTLNAKVTSDFDDSQNKLQYRNGLCYYDFSLKFTSAISASNLLEIAYIQSPYYPLEKQMFPCYLSKSLAGSDCVLGKLFIGTDGKVQLRVPSGNVADYQYLYAHCYYEPKVIGE